MAGSVFDGEAVSLDGLLDAKEERVRRQRELLRHGMPLVSFTLNIPGRVKKSPKLLALHDYGVALIEDAISGFTVRERVITRGVFGPEYIAAVDAPAEQLKEIAVGIEKSSPMARLFDIDILDKSGKKLSRGIPRRCLLCDSPAHLCARTRTHGEDELLTYISELIGQGLPRAISERVASLARGALIDEVCLTPKPGLVDTSNSGSHTDMSCESFIASAYAITPYFEECFRIGCDYADRPCDEVFAELRRAGLSADERMLAATGGVNTHKGAIYSFGIVIGAYARLTEIYGHVDRDSLFATAADICRASAAADLEGADGKTHGEMLYLRHGIRGIRGEAMSGFPSVKCIGLPTYEEAEGADQREKMTKTLLTLISHVEDSTLYHRGGKEGAEWAMNYARRLLADGDFSVGRIREMDLDFISRNLSPGGSADLLALTVFVSRLLVG